MSDVVRFKKVLKYSRAIESCFMEWMVLNQPNQKQLLLIEHEIKTQIEILDTLVDPTIKIPKRVLIQKLQCLERGVDQWRRAQQPPGELTEQE